MTLTELAALPIGISSITLGDVAAALLTLIVCLIIVRIVKKLLRKLLRKSKLDERVKKYVISAVSFALNIIAALLVIDCLGIPVTSLVALLSVGSLGLTLAAEDILGNMAGGLVVLSSRQFSLGDYIEAGGVAGTVEAVNLNNTVLQTPDGQRVTIPNKSVAGSQLINYTALGRRRVVRKVTASYGAQTETVKNACLTAAAATPRLLDDPAPVAYLSDYGASSIEYSVFAWCKPEDYIRCYYVLGENLRSAFDKAGVEMSYDHLNVHIVEGK